MATWPPSLDDLKDDRGIDSTDDRNDDRLETVLDAAVAFVERVRSGDFRFDPDDANQTFLPPPTADLWLGTLMLASRWHSRKRSPDALIQMGEMGAGRVPSFDADIDRLLGIGQKRGWVFA